MMPPIGKTDIYKKALQELAAKNADRSGAGTPTNKVPDFIGQMQAVRDRYQPGNGQGGGTPKQNPMMDLLKMLISKFTQGSNSGNAWGPTPAPVGGDGPRPISGKDLIHNKIGFKPYDPRTVQGSGTLEDPSAYYDPNMQIPGADMNALASILAGASQRSYGPFDKKPFDWTSSNA